MPDFFPPVFALIPEKFNENVKLPNSSESMRKKCPGSIPLSGGLFCAHPPSKFYGNLCSNFCVILLKKTTTNKQRNVGEKHNLLGRCNTKLLCEHKILYEQEGLLFLFFFSRWAAHWDTMLIQILWRSTWAGGVLKAFENRNSCCKFIPHGYHSNRLWTSSAPLLIKAPPPLSVKF